MAVTKKSTAAAKTVEAKTAKTPAAKAPAAKTAAPAAEAAPAKKAPARKPAEKKTVKVFVEYSGRQIATEEVLEKAKAAYVAAGNKASSIKNLEVYVKPEENVAYYVVNGTGSDDWKVDLD